MQSVLLPFLSNSLRAVQALILDCNPETFFMLIVARGRAQNTQIISLDLDFEVRCSTRGSAKVT